MFGEYLGYSMKIIILMAMSVLLSLYGRYWYVMQESSLRLEKNTATKIPAETKQSIYTKIIHSNQLIEILAHQKPPNEFPIHINQSGLITDSSNSIEVTVTDNQIKSEQQWSNKRSHK